MISIPIIPVMDPEVYMEFVNLFENVDEGIDITEAIRQLDEFKTHNIRCIGCGRFVSKSAKWNQCADCRDDWGPLYG